MNSNVKAKISILGYDSKPGKVQEKEESCRVSS
jgi:hypothetical protein